MTQITVHVPDVLGRYLVRFDGPFASPLAGVRTVAQVAISAAAGWVSSAAWMGQVHPAFGVLVFYALVCGCYPNLAWRMRGAITDARLSHALATVALAHAAASDLIHPRTELGEQRL